VPDPWAAPPRAAPPPPRAGIRAAGTGPAPRPPH
jgi:hypothetical protein